MPAIIDRLRASLTAFEANPAAAVTRPTATAALNNGHARISSGPFNWDADLGRAVGGENLAPSPTAYLLGALAGCAVAFLCDTLAPLFEVTLDDVQATASCRADLGGLLGIKGRSPALEDVRLEIVVQSPSRGESVDAMLDAWRRRCPIFLALITSTAVRLDTRVASGAVTR